MFRLPRLHLSTLFKCLTFLLIIYFLNLVTGVHYYIWSEKSFENDYSLRMTKIDLNQLDEEHPEKILGEAKTIIHTEFRLKNEYFCSNQSNVIILVKSAIENIQARQAIRLTWANHNLLQKYSIKILFVLGRSEKDLPIENKSDIIQIDQIDNYYHNSYKMLMMLRWIKEYCSSRNLQENLRQYVLFIDDDYYLNVQSLIEFIESLNRNSEMTNEDRRRYITGHVYNSSRPRRFLNDRWYISLTEYPYDRYPPYVTAGCFLMSKSNVRLFHLASKYLPFFRFDDIYMGLLAYSMSIRILSNNDLFSSYDSSMNFMKKWKDYLWNDEKSSRMIKPICIHGYRGKELVNLWNEISHSNVTLQ